MVRRVYITRRGEFPGAALLSLLVEAVSPNIRQEIRERSGAGQGLHRQVGELPTKLAIQPPVVAGDNPRADHRPLRRPFSFSVSHGLRDRPPRPGFCLKSNRIDERRYENMLGNFPGINRLKSAPFIMVWDGKNVVITNRGDFAAI